MYKTRIITFTLALMGTVSTTLWAQEQDQSNKGSVTASPAQGADIRASTPATSLPAGQNTEQAASSVPPTLAPDEIALIALLDRVSQLILANRRLSESLATMRADQLFLVALSAQQSALLSLLCSFEPSEEVPLPTAETCQTTLPNSNGPSANVAAELEALRASTTELEVKLAEMAGQQSGSFASNSTTTLSSTVTNGTGQTVPSNETVVIENGTTNTPSTEVELPASEPFVFARLEDGNPEWRRTKDAREREGIVTEAQCAEAGKWLHETVPDVYEYSFFVLGVDGRLNRCALSRGEWSSSKAAATDKAHILLLGGSQ